MNKLESPQSDSRSRLLRVVSRALEGPMLVLAFIWLGLLVTELTVGTARPLEWIGIAIWGVFVLEFLLKLVIAPKKLAFLRSQWLTAIALLIPAFRVLRVFRLLRFLRYTRVFRGTLFIRLISSVSRGMRIVGTRMQRRGVGYVLLVTVLVIFGGSAGMLAFERDVPAQAGLHDYGTALWWTTMIVTTMGTDYWPQTLEGRILCVLLALYGFAMFGYITANVAAVFIKRDARNEPVQSELLKRVQAELAMLRRELREHHDHH